MFTALRSKSNDETEKSGRSSFLTFFLIIYIVTIDSTPHKTIDGKSLAPLNPSRRFYIWSPVT